MERAKSRRLGSWIGWLVWVGVGFGVLQDAKAEDKGSKAARLETIQRDLASGDKEARRAAIKRLEAMPAKDGRSKKMIQKALSDPDAGVVLEALSLLERMKNVDLSLKKEIAANLFHRDPNVRKKARVWLQTKAGVKKRQERWLSSLEEGRKEADGVFPILLVMHAEWCGPCNQLANEILDTPEGRVFLEETVGVRLDFESPEGQKVTKKYGIFGLPCTLLLSPDGQEYHRLEGYAGRQEYPRSIREAFGQKADLGVLERDSKADAKNWRLRLKLARALLVAGKENEGIALLKEVTQRGGRAGVQAFTMWGRWYLRVQKRAKEGTLVFLAAMEVYRKTPSYGGFVYWAAKGYHDQGQTAVALGLFEAWAKEPGAKARAALVKADFLEQNEYDIGKTREAILQAKAAVPRSSWPDYLLAKNYHRAKKWLEARDAIEAALCRSPTTAIFVNFRKHLPALASYTPKTCQTP